MGLIDDVLNRLEAFLRKRRFARALRPDLYVPPWIAEAASFSFLDANPTAGIPAAKISWVEPASRASRMLARNAWEIQQAADSLDASSLAQSRPSPLGRGMGEADQGSEHVIARQMRALSQEREALCLLSRALKAKYSSIEPRSAEPELDRPQPTLGGSTLLAYYCSVQNGEAVMSLLEAGADPDASGFDGSSPLDVARKIAEGFAGRSSSAPGQESASILAAVERASFSMDVATREPTTASRRL